MNGQSSFYTYNAVDLNGQTVSMSDYQSRLILVVNTASKCGLVDQLAELEALYKNYQDKGLTVLGFPCGQFGNQEFDDRARIGEFCTKNYGVSFPVFDRVDVNGKSTHPIFSILKKQLPGLFGGRILWNFTKFLVAKDGTPLRRFSPLSKGPALEKAIVKALN